MNPREPSIALTIAGSDSGGGGGIQADLKTFHAFGTFGTCAVTAITAQNTVGVHAVHPVPVRVVRAQIDAVVSDLHPQAVKTGMLATGALVSEVGRAIEHHALDRFVLDPVMVSTSGDRLLDTDAVVALREVLLPMATLVTPNLEEAAVLTGLPVATMGDMQRAARSIVALGASSALVTGGHLEGDAIDVLWNGEEEHTWCRTRIETRHTHGTGCTLSAAITAGLARGDELVSAVETAMVFIERAIAGAPGLGRGHGPVNHFVSTD